MQPSKKSGNNSALKDNLPSMQNKLKNDDKMPSDVAIQVKLRKEAAKKYENRIENFLKQLLKGERVSRIQFIVLEDEEDDRNYFFKEDAASTQNGDMLLQKLPFYDQSFDEPLGCDEENNDVQEENKAQGLTCFNCLGSHHLKECPEEHDSSRISNNKKNLMETPAIRYHTDDAQPMENSTIRPGYISNRLREALNLRPNQLPIYIYNMRILGYPPGWMKEAEIESSGLAVYDSNGEAIGDDDDSQSLSEAKRYDGKKFISFPGFNTPVPEGLIDEYKKLLMPPLQKHQQLSEALKHKMVTISPELKKRKLDDHPGDMKKDNKKNFSSDTMKTPVRGKSDPQRENSNGKRRASNAVISGSPLINTGNPYKKLPDSNKFAEGMSEYLPYENLPDAIGTFDKMRGVLDDVRVKMAKQQ